MARKKRRGKSMRSYFVEQFNLHPDWLELSDNTNIINQWMADHGGKAMPNRVKKSMATCKSAMRSALRRGPGKKGRRRKAALAVAPRASVPGLEQLDEMIDLCVGAARVLNVAGIEPVLKHLRVAQAHIVLLFDDNR